MRIFPILLLATAQAFSGVKVGEPAPAIELDALLPTRPAANARLSALAGKAVVLEFWATWCGPCYFAIPHLNQLAEQFRDKPIQFLSITDEELPSVEGFLKKRPISGWVGIDRKNALHRAYGFGSVPVTVLIDSQGKVAAISHPGALEAHHLEDLLAGRPVDLPPLEAVTDMSLSRDGAAVGVAPLVDFLIRPSTTKEMSMSGGNKTKFQVKGVTARWLLAAAYNFPQDRVIGDTLDDPTRYDVSLVVPGAKGESLRDLLPGIVCTAFGLKATRQTKDTKVLILKAPHGKPESLRETSTPGKSMWTSQNHEVHIVGFPVSVLASVVQSAVHKNVIDETGIQGKYDFDFTVDSKTPNSVLDVVRKFGFAIEADTRPLEFLVLNKIQ
jgi:uncharacterized protein (TIGR03435 family)